MWALQGVAATLALGPVPAVSDDAAPRRPAPEEVQSYARHLRVPGREAARQLDAQARLPALERAARARLYDAFRGIGVDDGPDPAVTLGIRSADPVPSDALVRRAEAAIADAGLKGDARWVRTVRAEADVLALQSRLGHELREVNAGATDFIDVVPNLPKGTVDMLTPTPDARTVRQQEYLRGADERLGTAVRVLPGPGPLQRW